MSPEMRIAPITPEQARQEHYIPDEIMQIVNDLLTERASQGYAYIKQKEIVSKAVDAGLDENDIFRQGWLQFKDRYIAAGWAVKYDRPGYNESYDAFFEFRAAK